MKFQKTVPFDLYAIGDRVMEDVIYNVDLAINDENHVICTGASASDDAIAYLVHLGGKGGPNYWKEQVLAYFENEDNCAEELGEAMSGEEFNKFEDALMGHA